MGTTKYIQVQQCLDQFGHDANLLTLLTYCNDSTTVKRNMGYRMV